MRSVVLIIGAAALVGAAGVHQAVHGGGRLHAIASKIYHHWKDNQTQQELASQETVYRALAPMPIFQGTLQSGWQDWSWATHSISNGTLALTPVGFKGVYLHHSTFSAAGYGYLEIEDSPQEDVKIAVVDASGSFLSPQLLSHYGKDAKIPLRELGVPKYDGQISGVVLQAAEASAQPQMFVTKIALLPDPSLPLPPTNLVEPITVSASAAGTPISPYIYGMAFAPPNYLRDLHLTVNRWGGNDKSRYNWVQGNSDNAASDWNFANRVAWGDAPPGPSSAADAFVRQNQSAGAATLLTVPTLGWVARNANNSDASQGVPSSGGPALPGTDGAIAGYDPAQNRALTSVRSVARKNGPFVLNPPASSDIVYEDEWIHHLVDVFGDASHGGVTFYAMDNEPDLWSSTQRDVHPAEMSYDSMLANFLDYASAVKAVDPSAMITGPVLSGWTAYEFSALDRGTDNFHTHADQNAHGGEWFLPWFLSSVHRREQQTGHRLLDVLDIHYYPQEQGVYGDTDDPGTQDLRLRSTRSLWDPTYTDESWIGTDVDLIPRMQDWIAKDDPGVHLGITEWNFGGEKAMDGGLAAADALGIYGRYGVYLANYWAYPPVDSPVWEAFALYRNPDGRGDGFGDLSLPVRDPDPNQISCYAARDSSTGDLTLMLINKMPHTSISAPITLSGLTGSEEAVQMWRVSADNPNHIQTIPATSSSGSMLSINLPEYSMTLVRIHGKGARQ